MRLKVFFAPFVFLIVIIIVIWYVWPAIGEIMAGTKELKMSKNNLSSASEKKENFKKMNEFLDKNKEKEDFVINFLPYSKNEEKIVDGLNYLATDSSLSLINISLENEKVLVEEQPIDTTDSSSVIFPGTNTGATAQQAPIAKVKNVIVKTTFSGKYEDIKMFVAQVQKMQMFNKLNLISIEKPKESTGSEQPSDILTANLEISFGYMPSMQITLNENSQVANLDISQYDKLKNLIIEKIPALDTGEKGKSNPFIP